MSKHTKSVIIAAALVGMLSLESCKKYDEGPGMSLRSAKSRLAGDWEVTKVDAPGVMDPDIELTFEFEKDGDFTMKYNYTYYVFGYFYSYNGEWEFSNDKKEIELNFDSENFEDLKFDIKRLTNKEMIWEDEDGYEWELEAE